MTQPILLNYAGPVPIKRRSTSRKLLRGSIGALWGVLLIVIVLLRAVLLLAGLACRFVGAILLLIGGRRNAVARLGLWRARWAGLLRLWVNDMVGPARELLNRSRKGNGAKSSDARLSRVMSNVPMARGCSA